MIKKFNTIEQIIKDASKDSFDLTIWKGSNPDDIYKALTVDRHLYHEPVVYSIDSDEQERIFERIYKYRGMDAAMKFVKEYGRKEDKGVAERFSAMLMLQYKGLIDPAKIIADGIMEDHLRKKYYPRFLNKIERDAYQKKLQENAKKPRNRHHDEAIQIASLTWEKFPGASKGSMCKKLHKYFNGQVSVDTLDIWIRKAGIQPPRPAKNEGFSLVIPRVGE
ncbi:hypothetical protein MJO48_03375 [Dickeya fangzhongdai]|uniref:hypothetical protein n=1 Tax=Dickeya fangzhongdai TaxID=1778540 RepID=UPI001EFC08D2|nr:hypothetical protein [Dickeya fangzhongdai]ULR31766.1 hypothetical protein MJO48_03375 [Dickeya fangzhongdai]